MGNDLLVLAGSGSTFPAAHSLAAIQLQAEVPKTRLGKLKQARTNNDTLSHPLVVEGPRPTLPSGNTPLAQWGRQLQLFGGSANLAVAGILPAFRARTR